MSCKNHMILFAVDRPALTGIETDDFDTREWFSSRGAAVERAVEIRDEMLEGEVVYDLPHRVNVLRYDVPYRKAGVLELLAGAIKPTLVFRWAESKKTVEAP